MHVIRLGKRLEGEGVRARAVLIKMENEEQKWRILKNAKNLRNAVNEGHKSVSIVPDMTMKEREQDKRLVDELKIKRGNGEQGWYISRGELKRRNF